MALSIMAFAYGIAARFRQDNLDVEATRLRACVAYLEAENARLLDRLSVRLDELNDLKRRLAEAKIEARLGVQNYPPAAFTHPWVNEIAECTGGGRTRCLKGTKGEP